MSGGINSQHPQNGFFFVAAITAGVDANGREFASFAPALNGESRDTEKSGHFGNCQQIGEIGKIQIFSFDKWGWVLIVHV